MSYGTGWKHELSTLLLHNNVMGAAACTHDVSVAHADNLDH